MELITLIPSIKPGADLPVTFPYELWFSITPGRFVAVMTGTLLCVWILIRIAEKIASKPALPATLVGVLILYYPTLYSRAFSDDFAYVFGNQILQNASLVSLLTGPTNSFEHLPLRDLSYWVDWQLFGANPAPYKLHNLGWYFFGCLMAGFASRQLALLFSCSQQIAERVGFATLLLFAFHPLHVESVAWISGRKELISGAFTLLATGLFAKGLRGDRDSYLWGSVLAFAAAMAGKSSGILFPLVALSLALPKLPAKPMRLAPIATMFGIAVSAYLYAKAAGVAFIYAPDMWGDYRGSSPGFAYSLQILGLAFWKSVVPLNLRLIYDDLLAGPAFFYLLLGLAAVVSGVAILWRLRRTQPLEAFCVVWFATFTVPFLQVVPFRTWSPFSDRFAYLSVFAVALGIASLITRLAPRAAYALIAFVLLSFSTLTAMRAYDWRSVEALIRQNAEGSPNSSASQAMLIEAVLLPAGQYREADAVASRLEARKREWMLIRIRYAQLEAANTSREARQRFLRAAYVSPPEPFAMASTSSLMWYSTVFLANDLFAEAEEILRILLARQDVSRSWRFALGLALKGQNRPSEALREFEQTVAEAGRDEGLRLKAMQAAASLTGSAQ